MSEKTFKVNDCNIKLKISIFGNEVVAYNEKIVSRKNNWLGLPSIHCFGADEDGKSLSYKILVMTTFSCLKKYKIKQNDYLLESGELSVYSFSLVKNFFFVVGILWMLRLLHMVFPYVRDFYSKYYGVGDYIDLIIDFLFGAFFVFFCIFSSASSCKEYSNC